MELGKRLQVASVPERPLINSPADVANLVSGDMANYDQEHFRVLVLDTKNHVLAMPDVFVGSVNSTTIRTAEVFREAVRRNAPGIIIVHNHPSGDPAPSAEDAGVTREIVAAGKALDIEVLDHVVIGRNGYVSLKDRGLGSL
jgi:DNA repair protein RadC